MIGFKLWSPESVYDEYIEFFNGVVNKLNRRLSEHKVKYRYKLDGESVQMVRQDTQLDVPKEDSDIQQPDDNQPPEHHQNQSLTEFWNKKSYRIAVIVVILTALLFLFGDNVLVRLWDYLPTIKEKIAGWFR